MIADEIRDVMQHVRDATDGLEEGSEEWDLMHQAHAALALAHSLLCTVNTMRFKSLMETMPGE